MANMLDVAVAGILVSVIVNLVVLPLLPPSIRERVYWWTRRFRRYVLSRSVTMEMVSKASPLDGQARAAGEVRKRAAASMRSEGLDVTEDYLLLKAVVAVGRQDIDLSVRFVSDENDDFEQAEIVVGAKCGYRNLEICIAEMRGAQEKAKSALSKADMSFDEEFCIVCKLGSLPTARMLLDSFDADMTSCRTPDGHAFDLYDNKIEYYDTEVHRGMTSFLKKVLVAHS